MNYLKAALRSGAIICLLGAVAPASAAPGNGHGWGMGIGGGQGHGVPGPIAGAGLPFLVLAGVGAWRRLRRHWDAASQTDERSGED